MKPKKPYAEFPLFPHASGQWSKKIKGKLWYFGTWSDPDGAIVKYLEQVDEIQAGRDPRKHGASRTSSAELSVADLCNFFLERQQRRIDTGEVSRRHFGDNLKSCARLVKHVGKFTKASAMKAVQMTSTM